MKQAETRSESAATKIKLSPNDYVWEAKRIVEEFNNSQIKAEAL